MPGPTSCRVAKTNTKIPEESNSSGQADGLLPVIESNEAALVLASYGRRYRLAAASPLSLSVWHNSVYFCKLIFNLMYVWWATR